MSTPVRKPERVDVCIGHLGELIRPDERRHTHPGADRVVRVQHCLGLIQLPILLGGRSGRAFLPAGGEQQQGQGKALSHPHQSTTWMRK